MMQMCYAVIKCAQLLQIVVATAYCTAQMFLAAKPPTEHKAHLVKRIDKNFSYIKSVPIKTSIKTLSLTFTCT